MSQLMKEQQYSNLWIVDLDKKIVGLLQMSIDDIILEE